MGMNETVSGAGPRQEGIVRSKTAQPARVKSTAATGGSVSTPTSRSGAVSPPASSTGPPSSEPHPAHPPTVESKIRQTRGHICRHGHEEGRSGQDRWVTIDGRLLNAGWQARASGITSVTLPPPVVKDLGVTGTGKNGEGTAP